MWSEGSVRVHAKSSRASAKVRWYGLLVLTALAAVVASPTPAAACTEGPAFARLPVTAAVSGTILSGPDSSSSYRVSREAAYVSSFDEQWILRLGPICNYPADKLKPGQRLIAVSQAPTVTFHPNELRTNESLIWLLDDKGDVTFDMNFTEQGFSTIDEILDAFGLPDTAMTTVSRATRTPFEVGGYIVIALGILLALTRRGRRKRT